MKALNSPRNALNWKPIRFNLLTTMTVACLTTSCLATSANFQAVRAQAPLDAKQPSPAESAVQKSTRLKSSLERTSPESQGVRTEAILEFIEAADKEIDSLHSFMLLRNGKVLAEAWWAPETPETPHILWSLSKSFCSTAVGFAIEEGKLSLDDSVLKYFPGDAPEDPSENLKNMTVRDLLTMSTGHETEPVAYSEANWIKPFLAAPVVHKPGTFFKYNTPATFMQSAIVQQVTGEKIVDYLQPRLFEPLGIAPPKWDENPQGISIGGFGLYLKTEDIAKFGQLFLQKGQWHGRQIIPQHWVEAATSKQVNNGSNPESDWNQGYGYQFWRCRHNAYRGDGKDGQFCIVLPDQNAVIVMTAKSGDMQKQLNLVWQKLLPAFEQGSLPENAPKQQELKSKIKQLKVSKDVQ